MKCIIVPKYQLYCTVIFVVWQKWRKCVSHVCWWTSNSDKQSPFTSSGVTFYSTHNYLKLILETKWSIIVKISILSSCVESKPRKYFLWVSKRDFCHNVKKIPSIFFLQEWNRFSIFHFKIIFKLLSLKSSPSGDNSFFSIIMMYPYLGCGYKYLEFNMMRNEVGNFLLKFQI